MRRDGFGGSEWRDSFNPSYQPPSRQCRSSAVSSGMALLKIVPIRSSAYGVVSSCEIWSCEECGCRTDFCAVEHDRIADSFLLEHLVTHLPEDLHDLIASTSP